MGNHLFFAAATRLPQCSGPVRGETRHCAEQEPQCASQAKSFPFWKATDGGKVFSLCDNTRKKNLCVRFVHSPRGQGKIRPAANRLSKCLEYRPQLLMLTFACILLSDSAGKKIIKNCIIKRIVLFIFRTACRDINKLQSTDKLFGVFLMMRMSCFLCQLQLCTSACQHLSQDKPYARVTASSLVTRDV